MTSTDRRVPAVVRRLAAAVAFGCGAALAADDTAAPFELEPLVVVATRHPGQVWDVAGSVTVVTAEQAQAELAADLHDLLRYQSALSFDGGGTRFGGAGFRIRGLGGNRVLTLVDGIPVAERFSVGSYADSGREYAELGLIRQVEILRGPASNLYGSKALGGVVAIDTLAPSDLLGGDGRGGHAGLHYAGDRDALGATASSAWGSDKAGVLLAATHRRGRERDAADAPVLDPQDWRRNAVLAKSTLATAAGTVQLLFDHGGERRDTDVRTLPGSGRFTNTTALLTHDEQEAWRAGASLDQGDDAGVRRRWRAFSTRAWLTQDSDELRPLAEPPVRQQRRFEFSQSAVGLGLDARQPWTWQSHRQVFGYGAEVTAGRLQQGRDALQTDLDDGTQTRLLLGETFPRRDFPLTETLEAGVYAHAELQPPGTGLRLLPGLRYDYYRLDSRPDARFEAGSPNVQIVDLHNDAWTPRLGMLYPLGNDLRLFAQYARGFRAPPAYDVNIGLDIVSVNARALPNPDLRAERSDAFELGLRYRGVHALVEFSVFETRYRDFILSNGFIGTDPDTGTRLFQSRNVERARIHGAELRWRQALGVIGARHWNAEIAGAWLRGTNRESGEPLPTVDPPRLVLGLDRETQRTAVRLRVTAADRQARVYDTTAAQFRAPGYAVVELIGEYRPSPALQLRAGVFNVLDTRHWEWGDVYGRRADDPSLPALARAGRSLSVGAQLRF